jgi:hypothetical protein
MITPDDLRNALRTQSDSWAALAAHSGKLIIGPRILPEVVLHAGIDCIAQPLPRRMKRGQQKACFANAIAKVRKSGGGLTYVEGFAMRADLSIPMHHGWCIDAGNRVIDPTWDEPEACVYVGVPIPLGLYNKVTAPDDSASAFDGSRGLRIHFLASLAPVAADLISEGLKQ